MDAQESSPKSAELRAFPYTPDSPHNRMHSRGPSQSRSRRQRTPPLSAPLGKQALLAWVVYAALDPAPGVTVIRPGLTTRPHSFPAARHSRGSSFCIGCCLLSTVQCVRGFCPHPSVGSHNIAGGRVTALPGLWGRRAAGAALWSQDTTSGSGASFPQRPRSQASEVYTAEDSAVHADPTLPWPLCGETALTLALTRTPLRKTWQV
ncbi:uncharacterized protein LOC112580880 [Bubalus bubalis]|uniref:uncharacterized protein LOC112580880 n=1 Tax=Bubalus bubalis TaxID=89462 RepID=UPI001D11DCED|nr:uncharacterized protein LOC112580880 [Bubalus bubalis]